MTASPPPARPASLAAPLPGAPPVPGGLAVGPAGDAAQGGAQGGALSGNLLAAASMAVWALGFPALEGLLATWAPLAIAPARIAAALLLLLPLWLLLEGWPRGRLLGLRWGPALVAGGLGIGGGAVTMIWAQSLTDPVTVAVIASVSPLTGTLVEWAEDRRPLSGRFLLGLAASVAGGVVATAGAGAGGAGLLGGGALAVLSCLLFSWGSHACVRALPRASAVAQVTASVLGAFGATALAALAAAALGRGGLPPAGAGWGDAGLLVVYGMGGMAVSQLLFVGGVRRIGIALASFHTNAAPFYVMLMMWALGGGWSWAQAAGAGVVALGGLLAQRR